MTDIIIKGIKVPIYLNIININNSSNNPCLIELNYPISQYSHEFLHNKKSKQSEFKINDNLPYPIQHSEFIKHDNYYESTWEQSDYKFLLYRLGRMSSTHFASSAGYDSYKTKLDSAYRIFGCEEEFSEESIRKMGIGTFLEPYVIESYQTATNNKIKRSGFCVSLKDDRIGFSPDGFCNQDGIIECKGVEKLYDSLQNRLININYNINNNYEHIPISHFCQMQGIMHLSDRKFAEYCVGVFNPNSSKSYAYYERIPYDKTFCEKMFDNINEFMKKEYLYVKNISDSILLKNK
jgi:hypothetical protein